MPYCKECGTELMDDDQFCPECGVKLDPDEKVSEPQAKEEKPKENKPQKKEEPEREVAGKLDGFVDECRSRGFSDDTIREELKKAGWNKEQIDAALDKAGKKPKGKKEPPKNKEPPVPKPKTQSWPEKKEKPKGEVKEITLGSIFSWIWNAFLYAAGWLLGVGFFIMGIEGLQYSPLGLLMMFLALLIIPTVRKLLRKKLNINLSTGVVILLLFILFILAGVQENMKQTHMMVETPEIFEEICRPYWECSEWGACTEGVRYRKCWDSNYCGTTDGKPHEREVCSTATRQLTQANPRPVPEST